MKASMYALLVAVGLVAGVAQADPRPFTFVYDTYPVGDGDWEYEQWVTWTHETEDDQDFNRVDFRHEFEFGLSDNFDLGLYLVEWRYEDSDDMNGTRFNSSSIEMIYYPLNPVMDPIGLGIYNEVGVGEHELEFEQKLLLQKNVGDWVFAYNFVVETEIEHVADEGEDVEVEGVLEHTFGASTAVGRDFRLGAEFIIASEYENWDFDEREHTLAYLGPNFHWQPTESFWMTVTPTVQVTDEDEEAKYNVRLIAGLAF